MALTQRNEVLKKIESNPFLNRNTRAPLKTALQRAFLAHHPFFKRTLNEFSLFSLFWEEKWDELFPFLG